MTRLQDKVGLTLVEVLVALVVLAVGFLAVVGLQATGLRSTRTAQELQTINSTARSELDVWKASTMISPSPISRTCTMFPTDCTVTILPCQVMSGNLVCSNQPVTEFAAHLVTVKVNQGERQIALNTVVLK